MEVMDRIEKLGIYFVYHNILRRFGLTFEQFVEKVDNGSWEVIINAGGSTR